MNSTTSPFFELMLLSVLLIFLALLVLFVVKKNKIGFNVKNTIKEVDRFYYSPKSFLSIMKVGEEIFIIGITESNISFIRNIEEKATIDMINLNYQKNQSGNSFADFFSADNMNLHGIKSRLKQMRQNKDEEN